MMKKCIILGFFLGAGIFAFTQTVKIADQETGNPLSQVKITVTGTSQFVVTDETGKADISGLPGEKGFSFSLTGYEPRTLGKADLINAGFMVYLSLTGISLDEVVISASRFEEKQRDVVQKIQVMRGSEIQHINQTSMADVLSFSGNVMVQKSQLGGGSPVIRGFETNKVLLVVDGIRMNNAIYRGGHLQNVITLDNSILERTELVFGPGSVVYGSDALGGVMHFYTRDPQLSADGKAAVKGNGFARYNSAASGYAAHGDVTVGGQKWGSLTSFTYSSFGDLRQGAVRNPFYGNFGSRPWYVERIGSRDSVIVNPDSNVQIGSGYQQYDFLQKIIFRPNEKVTHLVNVQYSTSSDVPRYDRLTQVAGGLPRFAQWFYGPQNRLLSAYTLRLADVSGAFDHGRLIFAYQNIEESRHDRRLNNPTLNHRIEKLDIFSFNADFDKVSGAHEFRYGAEAYMNLVESTAYKENITTGEQAPLDTRYPSGGSALSAAAIYGTHTWEISDKFILNDGIRFTYTNLTASFEDKTFFPFPFDKVKQNHNELNVNLGVIFIPAPALRLTANLASGFRAPNVDDLSKVFESVQGNVIIPNPDLGPEYTYTAELGLSHTIEKKVVVSATGYYTRYLNAIAVRPSLFDGRDSITYDGQLSQVTTTVNAGTAFIYGLEGGLSGNLNPWFSIQGTVNYTYGRVIENETTVPLDHIPPVFGKLSLNMTKGKARAEVFVNYSGWKKLEDYSPSGEDNLAYATELGMPAWTTLNCRLTGKLSQKASIQVACENMLDQNYRVFASNISAPGRNWIITLRGSF
ncbi:MAG: TonB-dependent receptor [Bacteroidia bacterium]